ncbi:acyl-CoA thioesterase [Halomicroarcula sp. GCM10025710]
MTFEFTTEVAVRYKDIDSYGHVNNVTYGTYLEEARIDYLEAVVGRENSSSLLSTGADGGTGIVIANLEIDFERPVTMTDSVTVGVRVAGMGEKSSSSSTNSGTTAPWPRPARRRSSRTTATRRPHGRFPRAGGRR